MRTIKSILVPVDFSDLAAESYQFTLHLAQDLSASVHLLYCMSAAPGLTTHPDFFQNMTEELLKSSEEKLQSFREAGLLKASSNKPPSVTVSVSLHNLEDSISRHSEKGGVDLVVMGTHGVKDAWDRMFGTHTTTVLDKIETPVLVLPAGNTYHPFKSICYATDFRDRDLNNATHLLKVLCKVPNN